VVAVRDDVLVIGGGPAGLAAAIAARTRGLRVTVVDVERSPIDKACGEGILPAGVELLRRLGVPVSGDDGFLFRGIRFLAGGMSIEASFPAGYGLAVRRTRLHQMLADCASGFGVRLFWGGVLKDPFHPRRSRWIVGADGINSRMRSAAGLEAVHRELVRFGFRRHYRVSPWTDFVEVYWGARSQVYVTPVSPDEVGVAVLSRDSHLRLDSALEEFPERHKRLRGAGPSSSERGAITASRKLKSVFRGQTVLIGDASGSVDAITGEGLSLAFHQAVALAHGLCCGDLGQYEAEHRRLARRPTFLADLLLSFDRFAWLRRRVLKALVACEGPILTNLLGMQVRCTGGCYR
jgi:flavin-dependent dehydrogenase